MSSKSKLLLSIFLLFLSIGPLSAQEMVSTSSEDEDIYHESIELLTDNETLNLLEEQKGLLFDEESDWDIIKDIPRDTWALIKAPVGWSKKQWLIASGVVSVTTLLMVGDEQIMDFFQKHKSDFTEDVAYWAEKGGSQNYVLLGAGYLVGTILKNKKLKKASVLAFSSLLISGVLVQGLKQIFARTRPYASADAHVFQGLGIRSSTYNSFPSGHSASAFAVAAAISTIYDKPLVKILAYTAASLTALSRVHDKKHWMSDIFMGSILGTVTGIFIAKRHVNFDSNFQVAPAVINANNQTFFGASLNIEIGTGKNKRKKRQKHKELFPE